VPNSPAFLARARTRATFHRLADALADLQASEQYGLDRAARRNWYHAA
jgi:hypothetical protein